MIINGPQYPILIIKAPTLAAQNSDPCVRCWSSGGWLTLDIRAAKGSNLDPSLALDTSVFCCSVM